MDKKPLIINILIEIVLLPVSFLVNVYSKVKNIIIYLILRVRIFPKLFKKIPYFLSARALYKNQYPSKNISKILNLVDKNIAWGILVEIEKIDKGKFLEILKCYDISIVKEYLFLDSMSRRRGIMRDIGINDQGLEVDSSYDKKAFKPIGPRRNIEELYDIINCLEREASSLYQYGESMYANELYNSLSQSDQRRLIALSLSIGSRAICDVINKLYPKSQDVKEILFRMDLQDKTEIEEIITQFKNRCSNEIKYCIKEKINQELQKAFEIMNTLPIEEAFWIFIYEDLVKDSVWIEAASNMGEAYLSRVRFHAMVIYDPKKNDKYNLVSAIRKADYVIHIHNHPKLPNSVFGASSNDIGFAGYWKSYRPELGYKMKFYIIQDDKIFAYA